LGNPEFELCHKSGKNKLYNILKAYSVLDPELGYTQGMNFIVGMLLMNICDEESAFWCFVYIMYPSKPLKGVSGQHNWRQIFINHMPMAIYMEKKIRKKLLKVAPRGLVRILEESDGETLHAAFAQHIISLFIIDQPYETARRLFEVFLLKGRDFIIKIISKAVRLQQERIVTHEFVIGYVKRDLLK
jgi:ecotropic viral integration site 5 protein